MDRTPAETAARRVGFTTLPIGLSLMANPSPVAELLGGNDNAVRVIAACDLALVPGLIAGRRKSSWMAARVALNIGIAGYCLTSGRNGTNGARAVAGAMALASIADLRTMAALRRPAAATTASARSTTTHG